VASYPTLGGGIRQGSQEIWDDDLLSDRSVNGSVRARAFFASKKRRFLVKHLLNATDRATLETFYDTNRALVLTFTWPPSGVVYSCVFARAPRFNHGRTLTDVEVELLQV
jgi:hypothetical protein